MPHHPTRRQLLTWPLTLAAAPLLVPASQAKTKKRLTQAQLDEVAHNHRLWLTGQSGGVYADLGGQDLSSLSLDQYDLSQANLAGARLTAVRARETRLFRANLAATDLSASQWLDCDLRYVDFYRATLIRAVILDTLVDAPYPSPDYPLPGLLGAQLTQTDLRGIRANVQITDASFVGADLSGADLRGAFGPACFDDANLTEATVAGCVLSGGSFEGARIAATDISDARLLACEFNDAQKAGFRYAERAFFEMTLD